MKTDVRTPVALLLLAVGATAVAQNAQAPQQDAPPPQPSAPPQPQQNVGPAPPPAASSVPQSPPPPRYTPTQQTQSPPAQSYPPPAPLPRAYGQPQWAHSDTTYYESNGFQYHPFRFHIDGGGTITQRGSETDLNNGWNVGAGFTWYPTSCLPFGIRVDGTYNEFSARGALLDQATATYGTRVDSGTRKLWGGDVDLELDLHFTPYVHGYLLAGGGWYRQQTTFRQTNYTSGFFCDWWGCGVGYFGTTGIVARNQTDWRFARNAGLGIEFFMGPRASFFVEARYMRLNPIDAKSDFLPIRAGLRF
jgi:opacity protein-like surface antigen